MSMRSVDWWGKKYPQTLFKRLPDTGLPFRPFAFGISIGLILGVIVLWISK
jgi:hypothetical protein